MTLVGYWPLNENSGSTAYDHTGNEDHGSPQGNPQFGSNGLLGQNAVNFDGDDWFESPGGAVDNTRTNPCSVVWWAKLDNSNNQYSFTSFGDWHLGTWIKDNLSDIRFHVNDSADRLRYVTTTPKNINVGEWHMYAGIYEGGSTLRLMVDGNTIIRGSGQTSTGRGPWDNFVIGSYTQSTNWNPIQGSMSEVRVYNRALTSSEVQYLYSVGKRGLQTTSKKSS